MKPAMHQNAWVPPLLLLPFGSLPWQQQRCQGQQQPLLLASWDPLLLHLLPEHPVAVYLLLSCEQSFSFLLQQYYHRCTRYY